MTTSKHTPYAVTRSTMFDVLTELSASERVTLLQEMRLHFPLSFEQAFATVAKETQREERSLA